MLVRVAITRLGCVVALAVAGSGCGRVVPYFTNEFGDTGTDGDGDGDLGTGDGDGEPGETWSEPDLPEDTWCYLPEGDACGSPDQKCVPADVWGESFECVPIYGPNTTSEACMLDPGLNVDDCDGGSYCYDGVCRSFCSAQGTCPGQSQCFGEVWLCIDLCDPLAQDCDSGLACLYSEQSSAFTCQPVIEGLPEDGEPCALNGDPFSTCGPGNLCVPAEATADCGGDQGCCSALCDLEDPMTCADALGAACEDVGFGISNIGVCLGETEVAVGELMFVEVFSDPPGIPIYEPPYEFIEILNVSDRELDIANLILDDFVGTPPAPIGGVFSVDSGDGGCVEDPSPTCVGPGRRVLFVGAGYEDATGEALVLRAPNANTLGTLLQPWTRLELSDASNVKISTYRNWDDPTAEPLPVDEQPMHRIDPNGPDEPLNWTSAPPTPGL